MLIRAARARQIMRPLSPETRAKIAKSHVGLTHTEESKAKISRNRKGLGGGIMAAARKINIAKAKAVLSEDQVRTIRRRCASGESHRSVAASLGLSKTTISCIVALKTYRWVDGSKT